MLNVYVFKKFVVFLHVVSIIGKMSESIEKTIDIDKVLQSKLGDKVRYVPGFVVKLLKRLVHEDEVNAFLWESRHLTGTDWLE